MQTETPGPSTRPSIVILVLAVVLALLGVGGLATGAADKPTQVSTASHTTTTTTDVTSDTSPLVTVDVPTTSGPATTAKGTATTKPSTATTTQAATGGRCKGASASKDPGAQKAPALGTYTYVQCGNGEVSDTFKVDVGADAAHRIVSLSTPQGMQSETRSYAAGVVREKFTIAAGSSAVTCDWNPDIVQYPAQLAVGTQWHVDSSCEDKNYGIKLHVTGSAKVVDRVQTLVGDTTVTAWSIDSDITLAVSGFANQTSHIVATSYYEPTSGLEVYDKATTNDGQTVEKVLKSLRPS